MVRPIPNTNGRTLLAITQATCVERLSSTCFPRTSQFVAPHLLLNLRTSKLQARAKAESVAFDALGDVEVVDPARAKIEVALTQLGGVGNDGANPEGAPDKAVERVGYPAFIVRELLDPAF